MRHKKKEKVEPPLQVVRSVSIDKKIDAAVAAKMAQAEEQIVTRLVERLTLASDKLAGSPPAPPIRRFFDPLAGP
jgi:hypothetical protein